VLANLRFATGKRAITPKGFGANPLSVRTMYEYKVLKSFPDTLLSVTLLVD
jgi:hypothetical protein